MNAIEPSRMMERMMGGNPKRFLDDHWRRRTLIMRDALPEMRSVYNIAEFLDDYRQIDFHRATLIIDIIDGRRRFTVPSTLSQMSRALKHGSSIALQALKLPSNLNPIPFRWRSMIELHSALCAYFLPCFPPRAFFNFPVSALDIFCSISRSTTGGHYDTGDVFFVCLEGEKEWTVEHKADPKAFEEYYSRQVDSGIDSGPDCEPGGETTTVVLSPGDCLYMPPYTYHRVSSAGPSLGVSFGLPAFNAIHLLASKLPLLRSRAEFTTLLPSAPESEPSLYAAAKAEQLHQLRGLLEVLLQDVGNIA
jgi:ribosomal protein L16 Arg81 hydroxylase